MPVTQEQDRLIAVLEDSATLFRKTQSNLKKCPKSRLTKGYIEARIKIIDDYWQSFKKAHYDLVKITPKELKGTLPYFLNEDFFIYEDLYNVLQGDLKDMLISLQTSPPTDSQPINTSCSTNIQGGIVHLPKIQLPNFSTGYEAWPAFNDLFISLVHNNPALSDVQKLHYLKSSVSGEAEALLKHIQVTASNYPTAWEILSTRYGNKRLILNHIMKRLFNQRKMTSQSAVQLRCLLDTTTECLNNLRNLSIPIDSWDLVIIHLLVQKLDPETHKSWEECSYRDESESLPTWNDFKKFIEAKFRTLELVTTNTTNIKQVKERSYHVAAPAPERVCVMCQENHTLCHCKEFIKMEPSERSEYVKSKHLCFNCLVPGHSVSRCKLPLSCRICRRRHHSLLHENKKTEPAAASSTTPPLASQHVVEEEEPVQVNTMMASHLTTRQGVALLATAVVEATNEHGYTISLRALIDPGSQATFISEKATHLLKLKRQAIKGTVIGVGSTKTKLKHMVQLKITSQWDRNFNLPVNAYVMSKELTTKIPAKTVNTQTWPHIKELQLADPYYFRQGSIDLLLGVKEYATILQPEIIKGPPGTPCVQKTHLGWILFGSINEKQPEDTYIVMHHQVDVDDLLKSMWELDVDVCRHLSKEEKICENIYETTTTRNEEGRYIVKLPFKTYSPQTPEGNTKEIATKRFLQLERKFKKSPELREEYTKVIKDYINQTHMEEIPEKEKDAKMAVYLPHHAVIRDDKETSKIRVVFDGSCKGSNNISLNEELLVGPQLQDDLRDILIRWRLKHVCFMADIRQMYRQVLVTKNDADFQRIVWRADETEDLKEYRLLRVTFGTAPAPYLAVKTLHQVADDEGGDKPQAVRAVKTNFYMDDWLDGADNVDEAITLAQDVTDILHRGGFQLTKWSSNNIEFMMSISEEKRSANAHIDMNLNGTIKALGIVWDLSSDTFRYNLSLPTSNNTMTKRVILSNIQKLFDPLGWIAPSTVMAKILMQKLWLERVNWDDSISETLEKEWRKIRADFINVRDIKVDRWLGTTESNKTKTQIHGFSDASMQAYAAVVYIRTETPDHTIETRLIAAKTRVAPLKIISLPRLELCGALLLSRLMKQIGQALGISTSNMYAWTDSSIVIAWLSSDPTRWKLFVANRVVEIIENLNTKHWHHVQSKDNPADLASRGMLLSELEKSELWWRGPHWLSETEIRISKQEVISTDLEMKPMKINTYFNTETEDQPIIKQFENFDNLQQLIKTIVYCRRFLNYKQSLNKIDDDITTQELEDALNIRIRRVQEDKFGKEIERLKVNKHVKKRCIPAIHVSTRNKSSGWAVGSNIPTCLMTEEIR